jgi:hypothetical protein
MTADPARDAAFEHYLETVSEDDGDSLLGIAESAFTAGWNAAASAYEKGKASEPVRDRL